MSCPQQDAALVYSTELFVMIVFILGTPILAMILRSSRIPGSGLFIAAYTMLTLSNIFTVVEGLWFEALFNILEHVSVFAGSLVLLAALITLLRARRRTNGDTHGAAGQ